MVKVLLAATISNSINSYLIPHIRLLHELGCEVDIACRIVRPLNTQLAEMGCRIHVVKFSRTIFKLSNLEAIWEIRRLVRREGYCLVHVHTPIAAFLVRFACRKIPGVKVLYTAHGFHFFKGAPLKNWIFYYPMERQMARYTDGLITINDEDYLLAKKLKLRRKGAVYKINGAGVDIERLALNESWDKNLLRKIYGFEDKDFILFFAAELNKNKHQDLLINAVNRLKAKIPNIKLLLAGEGNQEEYYKKLVQSFNLTDNVKFLGFRDDVPELLKISDIAVSSSRREGLPLNILEAMAVGLPVVATDCRGNRDLIVNGENGYIVGVDDVDGFASAIEKLYNSPALRSSFKSRSRSLSDRYRLVSVLKEMRNIYLNYLNSQ